MRKIFLCDKNLSVRDLLNTQEVAKIAKLSEARISQLIIAKILPAEKFGKANLIRRENLQVLEDRKHTRPKKAKAA